MRRSRQAPAPTPERRPHFEPRIEVQLQQIISLRRAASRNEQLLDQYHQDVARMNAAIAANPTATGYLTPRKQITYLLSEIERLNAETRELHGQIGELTAKLSDDDLLFLDARPRSNS